MKHPRVLRPDHKVKPSGRKLAHKMEYRGLKLHIENAIGSERHWTDSQGNKGVTKFTANYGYIPLTRGTAEAQPDGSTDHDHLDVYVGPVERCTSVFVVNQNIPKTGQFDEQKCILGVNNIQEAADLYNRHYTSPGFLGDIFEMSWLEFAGYCIDRANWGRAITPNEKAIALARAEEGVEAEKAKASPAAQRAAVRAYAKRNPEKIRAKRKVQTAVESGKLKKPSKCPRCGGTGNIQLHHAHGYAKKNQTRGQWLCYKCHRAKPERSGKRASAAQKKRVSRE